MLSGVCGALYFFKSTFKQAAPPLEAWMEAGSQAGSAAKAG